MKTSQCCPALMMAGSRAVQSQAVNRGSKGVNTSLLEIRKTELIYLKKDNYLKTSAEVIANHEFRLMRTTFTLYTTIPTTYPTNLALLVCLENAETRCCLSPSFRWYDVQNWVTVCSPGRPDDQLSRAVSD